MEGVRRKGNWLLAAGISLLLSFAHLREEDLLADEDPQVAWSLIEARQEARQADQRQRLAEQACQHLYSQPTDAHLDEDRNLQCVVLLSHDLSTPFFAQP